MLLVVLNVTYAEAWTALADWFAGQSTAALFAGYPWLLVLVFGTGTYLVARRIDA
ncbi:hypothetical protein KIH74_10620 [Kineosporia sp. J2-2]|uniref:Uncharacterized protein n=1 Tax=Kineosporia corallincola TaxID=2835133 RepID=A0ABS5TIH5_9ACTN|nr:hypothetical protein [Kineosporia corallincola]MBT0769374.1 hypothetical protein [Kineosporia corallincola]